MKTRRISKIIWYVCAEVLIFLLLLLTASLLWAEKNFGNIGFDEIVFTLNMPLRGASGELLGDYIKKALMPSVVSFLGFQLILFW